MGRRAKFTDQKLTVISPGQFEAVLFDMDGVVTRTAAVHFAAWKKTFDALLRQRDGDQYQPFTQKDYLHYVDGKPREDGVRSFVEARGINLPESSTNNGSSFDSISSIARMKDQEFLRLIHTHGVEPYETTIGLIRTLRAAGITTALVTASQNGREILRVCHLEHLFDAIVDGVDAEKLELHGKPSPDVFLEAARRLSVSPYRTVVVEDAEAGVEAGHAGHFGLVIGVARQHNREPLKAHGADIVVADLSEVTIPDMSDVHPLGMALADMDVTEANWIVSYDTFEPEQEGRRESLCALGNGKFCTRGAAAESQADTIHYPGTYVAGGYNSTWLEIDGQRVESEALVNMPNWLCLSFRIEDGEWFNLSHVEVLNFSQRLNLLEGILYRDVRFRDATGRETKLSERRFVHMRYPHLAGIEILLSPINWSGQVTIRTALDARILNGGEETDPGFVATKHLRALDRSIDSDTLFLKVITNDSKLVVAEAAKTEVLIDEAPANEQRTDIIEEEYVAQDILISTARLQNVSIRKTVSLYTSRDRGMYEAGFSAKEAVSDAPDFEMLISQQSKAWRSLWCQFDLFVETTEEYSKLIPSLLLHLNSFHALQTASPHSVDQDTGVPARGWTGEGYQGHIFWDDLFVFPFVNLRMPNISAALLRYRYRRLPAARKIARSHGASGACFPWQSASDGRERTPDYWWMSAKQKWIRDYTHLEIHVNGAIAYNVWQYFQVTMDLAFMYSYGCEILLEIARFFATFAKYNEKRGRYEIHGVIGPDEFHTGYPNFEKPGINNNAYTNIMAVWTLCRALELLEKLPADHSEHIRRRLNITNEELKLWDAVSRKMFVPITKDGVISQFEGYDDLKEFPGIKDSKVDPDEVKRALIENDGYLNQYQISKQADVLMLNYVFSPAELQEILEHLGYSYQCASLATNSEYYIPRTANQSTLSRVAHTWALSRLDRLVADRLIPLSHLTSPDNEQDSSEQIFYEALGSDYFDVAARGTTRSGIHMGAMAGTVDIVQRCYTGIVTRGEVLWIDPILPKPLLRLSFSLRYQGQSLRFEIDPKKVKISARHSSAKSIRIGYGDQVYTLNAGDTQVIALRVPNGSA